MRRLFSPEEASLTLPVLPVETSGTRPEEQGPLRAPRRGRDGSESSTANERVRRVVGSAAVGLFGFTVVINLLLLVQPLYMLQVYDRVLASGSVETLLYLSLLAVAALALLGVVDAVRSIVAGRLAARMEVAAGYDTMVAAMASPRASIGDTQPLRDFQTVRNFIGGRAVFAYLDLPFVPFFVVVLWFIHPVLFGLTLAGASVLVLLAVLNQRATERSAQEASEHGVAAMLSAQSFVRNGESIRAMGMLDDIVDTWGDAEAQSLNSQNRMNLINAWYAGLSKVLRMALQIAILGVGGYLVLQREMTGGMIFASSLISGRALQPIDQVIAGWKGLVDTRKSWDRLTESWANVGPRAAATALPEPAGAIELDQLVVTAPQGGKSEPLLRRISAVLPAGSCTALIGHSGAGKTTLLRAIVGAVPIRSGSIRIDGADIRNWDLHQLGRRTGYLAQEVELLPGTVAQNIARFRPDASDAEIVEAAQKAQVHDLIQRLPKGYDTLLGPAGQRLSGGQRQRIGLARAFFGTPRLLVLDEPNAHLDADGDRALDAALRIVKAEGVTVVIVMQRRNVAELADHVMILRDGQIDDFGRKEEVQGRQTARREASDAQKAVSALSHGTTMQRAGRS